MRLVDRHGLQVPADGCGPAEDPHVLTLGGHPRLVQRRLDPAVIDRVITAGVKVTGGETILAFG